MNYNEWKSLFKWLSQIGVKTFEQLRRLQKEWFLDTNSKLLNFAHWAFGVKGGRYESIKDRSV